jgi:hypothetical protein
MPASELMGHENGCEERYEVCKYCWRAARATCQSLRPVLLARCRISHLSSVLNPTPCDESAFTGPRRARAKAVCRSARRVPILSESICATSALCSPQSLAPTLLRYTLHARCMLCMLHAARYAEHPSCMQLAAHCMLRAFRSAACWSGARTPAVQVSGFSPRLTAGRPPRPHSVLPSEWRRTCRHMPLNASCGRDRSGRMRRSSLYE